MGNCIGKSKKLGTQEIGQYFYTKKLIDTKELDILQEANLSLGYEIKNSSINGCNPIQNGSYTTGGRIVCCATDENSRAATYQQQSEFERYQSQDTSTNRNRFNDEIQTGYVNFDQETQVKRLLPLPWKNDSTGFTETGQDYSLSWSGNEVSLEEVPADVFYQNCQQENKLVSTIDKSKVDAQIYQSTIDVYNTDNLPLFHELLQSRSTISNDNDEIQNTATENGILSQREYRSENTECEDFKRDEMYGCGITENDGYHNYLKLTHGQPPFHVQQFLDGFSRNREFGVISLDESGGSYFLKDINVFTYIGPSTLPENEATQLLVIKSKNREDFPESVNQNDMASDIYHFYPHGQKFKYRMMVKIPLTSAEQVDMMLLYSNTDHRTKPNWQTAECSSNGNERNHSPIWYCKGGYCYLFLSHFCLFCVVRSTYRGIVTCPPRLALLVSMFAAYDSNTLTVTLTFQTDKNKPPFPKTHTPFGLFIEEETICLSDNDSNLICNIDSPGVEWKLKVSKTPVKENLLQINNLLKCPIAKFQFSHPGYRLDSSDTPVLVAVIKQGSLHLGKLSEAAIPLSKLIHTNDNCETVTGNQSMQTKTSIHNSIEQQNGLYQLQTQNYHNQGAIPKTNVPNVFGASQNNNESDIMKLPFGNTPIEMVIPYINEKYEKEPDLPAEVKREMCNILDVNNWQAFGEVIGHGFIASCLPQSNSGESPSELLLALWQSDRKTWTELVYKLENVDTKAANILREWLIQSQERMVNVGESDNSSETQLIGHPPL